MIPNDFDRKVYDSPPDSPEDYETGYLTIMYATMRKNLAYFLRRLVRSTNTYGYIISEYHASADAKTPYTVLYVIHKDWYEKLAFDILAKQRYKYEIDEYKEELVWFHKHWICGDYKKIEFPNPAWRYRWFAQRVNETKNPPKELLIKYRIECMTEYGCYEQANPDSYICRTRKRNRQSCTKCLVSRYYDRYSSGKCIKIKSKSISDGVRKAIARSKENGKQTHNTGSSAASGNATSDQGKDDGKQNQGMGR